MTTRFGIINEADKAWHFAFECQWIEWFRRGSRGLGWRNFDVIGLAIESGEVKGRYVEVDVSFLGLRLEIEWCNRLSRAAWMERTEREAKDIIDDFSWDDA